MALAKRVEVLLSAHERLLDRARSISIGINHDLRTPLHVLVVQTEVSLCSPRSVADEGLAGWRGGGGTTTLDTWIRQLDA